MISSERTVIVSACRSPIGEFNGALSNLSGSEIGGFVIREALKRCGLEDTGSISEVILGQVYTAGCGQNPARQASTAAGLPASVPAWSLNMLCGSGLKAVAIGDQMVKLGQNRTIVVAGGQESMSQTPHVMNIRNPKKFGDVSARDSMIVDGLQDAFGNGHMGITAENVAKKWNIPRISQDKFSEHSQKKFQMAYSNGEFNDEIVAISTKSSVVTEDECPRVDTSPDRLSLLRPAFTRDNGTVTAGNSSKIGDGAAVCVLMSTSEAARRNMSPLVSIVGFAQVGCEPSVMGIGPVGAINKVLSEVGWSLQHDVEVIELNEAFAAQSLAVLSELGLSMNDPRINIGGGAIALGHPLGASGARCLVTLIHRMQRLQARKGLVSLCVGGGMGVAMCVERLE